MCAQMFNQWILLSQKWDDGYITLLFKNDDKNNPSNYIEIARGGSRGGGGGGGAHPARAPPKIGNKYDFFLRKIVIFHTNYPNYFRASLRSAQFF